MSQEVEEVGLEKEQEQEQEQEEEKDPLHIGNLIGIHSKLGYTKGRIIYRSLEMLRIMPDETSDRAVEFPMEDEGTAFAPDLGVTGVEVFDHQTSPFYVDFLGVRPGELLEFFKADGTLAAKPGEVAQILKSDVEGEEEDSIKLVDGRTLEFMGIGPPEPVIVIRVRTAMNVAAAAEVGVEEDADAVDAVLRQEAIAALLRSALPAAAVEIIPTAERTYPDSMQREELFQDLISGLSAKKQANARVIRAIEREVDLAVALKNKSIQRDQTDRIIGTSPYLITTVGEAVSHGPTPSAIPVVEGARVLNLDKATTEGYKYVESDVVPRALLDLEQSMEEASQRYLEGAIPDAVGGVNVFYAYNNDLVGNGLATLQGPVQGSGWSEDQDVIRTATYETAVQGLSKRLPGASDEEANAVTLAFLISNVRDRGIRVLTGDKVVIRKTGATYIAAPSDPSTIKGYIMLPPKAALKLRPPRTPGDLPTALLYSASLNSDNLPTVAKTLVDLYSADAGSPLNAWTLPVDDAASLPVAEWLQAVLRYTVHPIDSMGPRGPQLLSLLDALGLGATDLAPPVAAVINAWVSKSQKMWISLMKARRVEIQAALNTEPARTFQSVVGVESPLWAALRGAESLKELLEDIGRRNPTIADAPTLMTASLLVEAQGDATPIVWTEIAKLDSRELGGIDTASAAAALAASRAYALRRAALRNKDLVALRAEPEVNTCAHTKRLEAVRNVSDVLERSRLLRTFIEEFQGPKMGDWISCVLCKKECVCYHELMELEALAQPQRLDTIQKQMLIRFGGDRYEGKIVCKNCGQALQDIDYDDHVEFDDEGRPIQQASVLTDEQMEDAEDKALLSDPMVEFESYGHRMAAEALTDLLMHGRITMSSDVFRRIVNYTDIYVGRRAPDEKKYTELTEKKAKMASTKLKKGTFVADLPSYTETVDQIRVSALMALTTIAIQSENVTVSAGLPVCSFTRGGFPLDASANPAGPGALLYVSCVAADMVTESKYKRAPWLSQIWVGDAKGETRQRKALAVALAAVNVILGLDGKAALSFTPEIRMMLTKVQTNKEEARERSLISLTDELPVGFRPEPRPPTVAKPATERNPLPALKSAITAGSVSASMAAEISMAAHKQAIYTILEIHDNAKKSHRGDMCCPSAEQSGMTEMSPIMKAAHLMRLANTSAANAGTQLWPVQETPHIEPIEQAVDESVFFKLFLKFCYTGHAVGNPHEFSIGNTCRQCALVLGKPIDFIDFAKEGAGILAAQQGALRIEVTKAAFDALSDAARRRKIMNATPLEDAVDKSGLPALIALCGKRAETTELGAILSAILQTPGPLPTDEIGRAALWAPFSTYMETLTGGYETSMLDIMTEDPFIEGPRALQEYLCAKTQAAGVGYAVMKAKGSRWFNISAEHNEIINRILSDNAGWDAGMVNSEMKPILCKIAQTIGPLLDLWIKMVRPDPQRWTVVEAQMVLRALVMKPLHDATSPASWMYADIASPAPIIEGIRAWLLALLDYKSGPRDVGHKRGHVQMQFIKYSKEEVRRILQQRSELERTSVVEEFATIKDDDLRAAELIKKQFRIGRWGVGKNLQKYDADLFEFEHAQRIRMGVGAEGQVLEAPVQQEAGYAVEQGAEGDDY
jgi:hypothetical protein